MEILLSLCIMGLFIIDLLATAKCFEHIRNIEKELKAMQVILKESVPADE